MSDDNNGEFFAYISTLLLVSAGDIYISDLCGIEDITLTRIVIATLIGVSWRFFPSSFKYTWPVVLVSMLLAFWPAIDHWHYSDTIDPLSPWYDYATLVFYAKFLIKWGLLFVSMAVGIYANRSWLTIPETN